MSSEDKLENREGVVVVENGGGEFVDEDEEYDDDDFRTNHRNKKNDQEEEEEERMTRGSNYYCFTCLRAFHIVKSNGGWNKPVVVGGVVISCVIIMLVVVILILSLHPTTTTPQQQHFLPKKTSTPSPTPTTTTTTTPSVVCGSFHSCSISGPNNNELYCWGKNEDGQLGDNSTEDHVLAKRIVVVVVESTEEAAVVTTQISLGRHHTCAWNTNTNTNNGVFSSVFCWGDNSYGELGDGSTTPSLTPIAISMPTTTATTLLVVKQVTLGYYHSCAILSSSSSSSSSVVVESQLFCWGKNMHGRLGDGTIIDRLTPTLILSSSSSNSTSSSGGGGVMQVSLGRQHTCAISHAGKKLQCWGHNAVGQLGDGTTITRTSPITLFDYTTTTTNNNNNTLQQVSLGRFHACVLFQQGNLKCWGFNRSGQVGDGTMEDKFIPTDIPFLQNVSRVECGDWHTCATTTITTTLLYCWGQNDDGQLGDGTTTSKSIPTHIPLPKPVIDFSLGAHHTCAVLQNGVMKCWGNNNEGQLGDGTKLPKINATQVFLE